jgi:thioredoxin 1
MIDITEPNVPQITTEEVKKSLDAKEDVALLDVRTVGEYSRGKIEGGINLPVDEVAYKIESLIPDKSKKIYVYCLSGSRSVHAVEAMIKLGYSNVSTVTSGLLAWRAKGYPVVSNS